MIQCFLCKLESWDSLFLSAAGAKRSVKFCCVKNYLRAWADVQRNSPVSFFGDQSGKDCCRLVYHLQLAYVSEKGDSEGRLVEIL